MMRTLLKIHHSERTRTLQFVSALLIGVFFAVVISEIILQILDLPPRLVSGWTNCKNKHPGQCNYLGFRGREISYNPDDFVVLLVGDSEVYAPHLPFEKMPERRLEIFLNKIRKNVKVFTIADMGYGQDQQYLALKEYFRSHRADLVLLMFTFRDDLGNNIFPVSGGKDSVKPTFFIRDDKLFGPTEGWLEPIHRNVFKFGLLLKNSFTQPFGKSRLKIWEREILPPPYLLKEYKGVVDYSWQEEWNKDPQEVLDIEFERAGPPNKLSPRSERRAYGIRLTRRLMTNIKNLVEANGGHFVLFKEERPWELEYKADKVYFLKDRYYKVSMRQYHENLNDILDGFEHYRIPIDRNIFKTDLKNAHLTLEALDELFRGISVKLSQKSYFAAE